MHLPQPSVMGDATANLLHVSSLAAPVLKDAQQATQALLFQPVWRAEHLRILNVQEKTHVSPSRIVGKFDLPRDGKPDFEDLSAELCEPSPADILDGNMIEDDYRLNTFQTVFTELDTAFRFTNGLVSQNRYVRSAKTMIQALIEITLPYVDDEGSLRIEPNSVSFHLRKVGIRGHLACDACVIKTDISGSGAAPLPVLSISIARPTEDQTTLTAQQTSQLVLQAALAYEQDTSRDMYRTFALHIEGTNLQAISAQIPRLSLERLYHSQLSHSKPDEGFEVLYSDSFDLLEKEGRREALRTIFGLLKTLRSRLGQRSC